MHIMRKLVVVAVAATATAGLAGCTPLAHGGHTVERVAHAPAAADTTGGSPTGHAGLVVAQGHGWTAAGLDGTVPAPGSCHIRWTADKEPLPDPLCTPGAVDPTVTQGNLQSTVCRKGGYTSSVRPPEYLSEAAKRQIMAAYGIPWSQAHTVELDHLVPLTTGGASDVRNLWPEPNVFRRTTRAPYVNNDKDATESAAHESLCTGAVQLAGIQQGFAGDWTRLSLSTR